MPVTAENRKEIVADVNEAWSELLAVTPVLSRDLIREVTCGHERSHLRDIQRWHAGT